MRNFISKLTFRHILLTTAGFGLAVMVGYVFSVAGYGGIQPKATPRPVSATEVTLTRLPASVTPPPPTNTHVPTLEPTEKTVIEAVPTRLNASATPPRPPVTQAPAVKPASTRAPSAAAVRVGATCKDGSSSSSTGRGACSGHGGVQCWRLSDGRCVSP